MQAKTTFQKFFFGFIFVITVLAFIQLYNAHQANLRQAPCVQRTRLLLDMLTVEDQSDSLREFSRRVSIAPRTDETLDSAVILLDGWGRDALFDAYQVGGPDSGFTEKIDVLYLPPRRGRDRLAQEFSRTTLEVTWISLPDSHWRAELALAQIPHSR